MMLRILSRCQQDNSNFAAVRRKWGFFREGFLKFFASSWVLKQNILRRTTVKMDYFLIMYTSKLYAEESLLWLCQVSIFLT
jgi:hypothetical protein